MTRRALLRARRYGLDLSGLDKRQQRRALRRAGVSRGPGTLLTSRGAQIGSIALEVRAIAAGLVDAGAGTLDEATSHLTSALRDPVTEPLQKAGPQPLEGTIVEPTNANSLRLGSECLFSKWGFNDGDEPEPWLDYCDDHGIRYPSHDEWNQVLRTLVRERLVPRLPAHVELYDIDTIHNPIRAGRVDGRRVHWVAGDAENAHYWPEVEVYVSWQAVATALEGVRR